MLGKLIKHEFAATGRIMLPVLAALTGITLLANLVLRFGDALAQRLRLLTVLFALVVIAAVVALIAAEIMTVVLMVLRFYRNLLGPEGYLTHALPVNVHQLIWSKMIVSAVWIILTNLLAVALVFLSVLFIGRMNLGEVLRSFPSWQDILTALGMVGMSRAKVYWAIAEFALLIFVSLVVTCLHFYAAMALGHIFSRDKILLSVLFYVGISVIFGVLSTVATLAIRFLVPNGSYDSFEEAVLVMSRIYSVSLIVQLFQAALLYAATALGLKKGLNLA